MQQNSTPWTYYPRRRPAYCSRACRIACPSGLLATRAGYLPVASDCGPTKSTARSSLPNRRVFPFRLTTRKRLRSTGTVAQRETLDPDASERARVRALVEKSLPPAHQKQLPPVHFDSPATITPAVTAYRWRISLFARGNPSGYFYHRRIELLCTSDSDAGYKQISTSGASGKGKPSDARPRRRRSAVGREFVTDWETGRASGMGHQSDQSTYASHDDYQRRTWWLGSMEVLYGGEATSLQRLS
jgi:hypothetical protein